MTDVECTVAKQLRDFQSWGWCIRSLKTLKKDDAIFNVLRDINNLKKSLKETDIARNGKRKLQKRG
jgi:hypothetical protein